MNRKATLYKPRGAAWAGSSRTALLTPRSWTPSLQHGETINLLFKPPPRGSLSQPAEDTSSHGPSLLLE